MGSAKAWGGVAVLAAVLAACGPNEGPDDASEAPQMQAPSASAAVSARRYAPLAEAEALTGEVTLSEAARFSAPVGPAEGAPAEGQGEASPPPAEPGGVETTLTLQTRLGHTVEARLAQVVDGGATLAGQPVRSLMDLPLDARPFLFQITREDRSEGARAFCGERPATHLVIWEAADLGDGAMKLMVLTGDAPGVEGAVLCQVLSFQRVGG